MPTVKLLVGGVDFEVERPTVGTEVKTVEVRVTVAGADPSWVRFDLPYFNDAAWDAGRGGFTSPPEAVPATQRVPTIRRRTSWERLRWHVEEDSNDPTAFPGNPPDVGVGIGMTFPDTSSWFKTLTPDDRKALLCLLHDVRRSSTVEPSPLNSHGRNRACDRFVDLLHRLEEDHDATKRG